MVEKKRLTVHVPAVLLAAIDPDITGRGSLSAIVRASLLLWSSLSDEAKFSLLQLSRRVVDGSLDVDAAVASLAVERVEA